MVNIKMLIQRERKGQDVVSGNKAVAKRHRQWEQKKLKHLAAQGVCLLLALLLVAGTLAGCGKSKKKKKSQEDEAFVIEVWELGVLGEDTAYPIKMTLNSVGNFQLDMTGGYDVSWVWEGTDELTLQELSDDALAAEESALTESALAADENAAAEENAVEDDSAAAEENASAGDSTASGESASTGENSSSGESTSTGDDVTGKTIGKDDEILQEQNLNCHFRIYYAGASASDSAKEDMVTSMENAETAVGAEAQTEAATATAANTDAVAGDGAAANTDVLTGDGASASRTVVADDDEADEDSNADNPALADDAAYIDNPAREENDDEQVPLVDKEIAFSLIGKEVGLRYNFKVQVKQSVITALLESSVEEIEVSYEDVAFYEDTGETIQNLKLPTGARLLGNDVIEAEVNSGSQENGEQGNEDSNDNDDNDGGNNDNDNSNSDGQSEDGQKADGTEAQNEKRMLDRVIIGVGEQSYRLATTASGDAFDAAQMKQLMDGYLAEMGKNPAEFSKTVTIAGTEATLYRMGEVAVAVYAVQNKNCMLFIDDESEQFDKIEAAAKLFIEVQG